MIGKFFGQKQIFSICQSIINEISSNTNLPCVSHLETYQHIGQIYHFEESSDLLFILHCKLGNFKFTMFTVCADSFSVSCMV